MTPSIPDALLPCPFCGGEGQLIEVEPSGYVVGCTRGTCNSSTNIRFSCGEDARPLVIEQWNRRAALPHLAAGEDAERWRWLRDVAGDEWEVTQYVGDDVYICHLTSKTLDTAIDAARGE